MHNCIADSLATYAIVFKIPIYPNRKYEIEVKHKPSVPNNVKNWQVFEDDKQIHNFLNLTWYFDGLITDEGNMLLEGSTLTQECLESEIDVPKEMPQVNTIVPAEGIVGSKTEGVAGPH